MTMVKVKNRSQNERRTKNDRAPSTTTRAILPKRPRLKNLRLPRTARHSRRANRHASHRHQVLLIRARRRHHLLLPRKHRHRQRPHPPQRKSRLLLLCLPQTCPLLRRRNRPPLQRKFYPLRRANRLPQTDQPPWVPRVPTLGYLKPYRPRFSLSPTSRRRGERRSGAWSR